MTQTLRKEELILELNNGKVAGFMLAEVLKNDEEEKKGYLKLRLLCDGEPEKILEEVRIIMPFGGKECGFYFMPEAGEEVLVGFLGTGFDKPFVLGSFCTDSNRMLKGFHQKYGDTKLVTKGGCVVEISDISEEEDIRVCTPDGKLSVELQRKSETVTIKAGENHVTIGAKEGNVQVVAQKKIELKVGSTWLTMDEKGLKINGGEMDINGSFVNLSSNGRFSMKGKSVELSGSMVSAKASGIMEIKGVMTKIN